MTRTAPIAATPPAATARPTSTPAPTTIAPGPTPLGYRYDLSLNPTDGSLSGAGALTVRNDQNSALGEVYLRLWANATPLSRRGGRATIGNVLVDGASVTPDVDRTVVKVPLPKPLAAGEQATVNFDVGVRVPDSSGRTGRWDGNLSFGNALPTLAVRDEEGWNLDPYVSMGESFYNLASDWQVRLHAPENVQLITTGSAASEHVEHGIRTATFDAPHVRDFNVVATRGYQQLERMVDGTRVRVSAPASQPKTAQRMLDVAARSLQHYNQRFGKYDYPELDVVAVRGMGGGMEFPNLTLVDTGFASDLEEVVAHENGHQWFYGMAGNNQFDEPFLDESLTSFATADYLRSAKETERQHALRADQRAADAPGVAPAARPAHLSSPMHLFGGSYFSKIYREGPRAVQALHTELGEETFWKGMHTWFESKRNGIQTLPDFIRAMSDAAGRDLTDWFAQHDLYASDDAANDKLDPNGSL